MLTGQLDSGSGAVTRMNSEDEATETIRCIQSPILEGYKYVATTDSRKPLFYTENMFSSYCILLLIHIAV